MTAIYDIEKLGITIDLFIVWKYPVYINIINNDWKSAELNLNNIMNLDIPMKTKKKFFNEQLWIVCSGSSSVTLKNLIQYCIVNNVWEQSEPQLERFIEHGTIDHLKVLYNYGHYTEDSGSALEVAVSQNLNDKIEYLLKTYTYTVDQLINVCAIAKKKCNMEIHDFLKTKLYLMMKDNLYRQSLY